MPRVLCIAAVAAMACTVLGVYADGQEYRQTPSQRGDRGSRPPHADKPLQFRAPPSQLLEAWRCTWTDPYAPPFAVRPCQYDPRMAPDFLMDPYVTQRLMPPMRAVPPPSPPVEPVPDAPPPPPAAQ